MRTAEHLEMAADTDIAEGRGGRSLATRKGIVAVVVERGDGTCTALCRGSDTSWPSTDVAKDAVERISPAVMWREITAGVWVARTDGSESPFFDRSPGHSRREAPKASRPSTGGDTYMAALVLRGTAMSGPPGGVPALRTVT